MGKVKLNQSNVLLTLYNKLKFSIKVFFSILIRKHHFLYSVKKLKIFFMGFQYVFWKIKTISQ